jgi:NCS2 family nucleobase:cation symporter-2
MSVKPADLIYGVDENPPIGVSILLAIQHLLIAVIYLVYPVIVVTEGGGAPNQATFYVQMSMLAIGFGTIMQVRNRGPIGSGFLIPHVTTAAYLSPSLLAARAGGMALVLGMTIIAGFFEGFLSRFMNKLRVLFPPEVSGVVVAMIGFSLAKPAILRFAGLGGTDNITNFEELIVGCLTLFTMVSLVVWSKGGLRLYSAAIGLGVGYSISIFLGIFDGKALSEITSAPLIALPSWEHPGLRFDIYLLPLFLIGALASAVKASGVVINCQKINEPDWRRVDMSTVSNGMLADGIGCAASGLIGGMGTSMSAANVGLSMATGATSRRIGYLVGILFISMVFFPKFSVILTLMPLPVMGAGLLYVASYLIASGIQLIMTRMVDSRRTFIVGLSFLTGISLDVVPVLYEKVPEWASHIFSSSLTVATLVAFMLNLFFRLGISQKATLVLSRDLDVGAEIYRFLENHGATWGARHQVIHEAKHILRELVEALFIYNLTNKPVQVEALFDEFNLNMHVTYKGKPMDFPRNPPSEKEMMNDKTALVKMSGFMIQFMADNVTVRKNSDFYKVDIHVMH